jgi:hypothetical protein
MRVRAGVAVAATGVSALIAMLSTVALALLWLSQICERSISDEMAIMARTPPSTGVAGISDRVPSMRQGNDLRREIHNDGR